MKINWPYRELISKFLNSALPVSDINKIAPANKNIPEPTCIKMYLNADL